MTLYQPWASLITHGSKRIENRTRKPWPRLMGQFIGIHAAKRIDPELESEYVARYDLPLPHGALLGFARITGIVTVSDDPWFIGPVGIQLSDVVAYPDPIVMRGARGYWPVLDALTPDTREYWAERTAIRECEGAMASDLAQWWALHDATRSTGNSR